MSAKDYVKSLTAEIIGLGIDKNDLTVPATVDADQPVSTITPSETDPGLVSPAKDNAVDGNGLAESDIAGLLGHATLKVWGQLPRDAQEAIFESAIQARPECRTNLATFLHDIHPRTMHPSQSDPSI
jgi:hypothetical protein